MDQTEFGPHNARMVFGQLWRHFAVISIVTGLLRITMIATGTSFFGTMVIPSHIRWIGCLFQAACTFVDLITSLHFQQFNRS
jgi:hypothetical protein